MLNIIPAAETVDKVKISFMDWLAKEDETKQRNYDMYREYYDGEHATQLTDRQREYLQVKSGQEFNTNYCPIVVDAVAERLIVTGFDTNEESQEDEGEESTRMTQAETFWEWWTRNRMDALQRIVHTSAGRDGDTYLIVSWDDERDRPVFTPEMAYDGHQGVKIHYSQEKRGLVECASKRWRIERGGDAGYMRRLNMYYPNRVEKYISDSRDDDGNWREYVEEGEEDHVKWWTDTGLENGAALGVPVFHFKAADWGYDYGKSDLHDIIPVQNALNKSVIDLLAAADTTGFRIFTMIGVDPSNLTIAPGMWSSSMKPPGGEGGASIGHIPGENLAPMIELKDSFVSEIARISRTPLSYFQASGQRAAEGTLKQQESGLVAKVSDRQVSYGNAWEDAMEMARRLSNAFGSGPEMSEDIAISTLWADAQVRNEKDHIETIGLKVEKLGIPTTIAWQEAGYSPAEIANMIEEAQRSDGFGFVDIDDEVEQ